MNCRKASELLGRLLFDDWDDDPGERGALVRHLSVCAECTRQLEAMRASSDLLREGLASGPDPVLSPERMRLLLAATETNAAASVPRGRRITPWPWRRQVLGVAAAATILAGGLFSLVLRQRMEHGATDVAQAPSEPMSESVPAPTRAEPGEASAVEGAFRQGESETVGSEATPRLPDEAQPVAADALAPVVHAPPAEPRARSVAPRRKDGLPPGPDTVTGPQGRAPGRQNRPRAVLEALAAEQQKARAHPFSPHPQKPAADRVADVGPALPQPPVASGVPGDREATDQAAAAGRGDVLRRQAGAVDGVAAPEADVPRTVASAGRDVVRREAYEAIRQGILSGRLPPPGIVDPLAFADAFAAVGDGGQPVPAGPQHVRAAKRRSLPAVDKAGDELGAGGHRQLRADMAESKEDADEAATVFAGGAVPLLPGIGEPAGPYLRACAVELALILREQNLAGLPQLARMSAGLRQMEASRPTNLQVKELRVLTERVLRLLRAAPRP